MKVGKQVHLAYWIESSKDAPLFNVFNAVVNNEHFLHVASADVEFEVDDTQDFTPAIVQALRDKQETIRAEAQANITKIDERINSLLAIECKVMA